MKNFEQISKKIQALTIDNPRQPSNIKWYNIVNPEKKEIAYLKKKFNFKDKHLEASLVRISAQRPMIFEEKDYVFIILHFPVIEKGQVVPGEIEFFVGHGYLITLHDNKIKTLNNFCEYCKNDSVFLESYNLESSAVLLYEILEKLIQDSYALLDKNNIEINKLEKGIFESEQEVVTSQLLILKRNIINIRRIVENHKNIMKKLTEMKSSLVSKEQIMKYYGTLAEHSERIWEFSDTQKEIIDSLQNTSESISDNKTNNIMKTLTVLSAILMPMNLLATILGMNLNPGTYPFSLVIVSMIVMAIVLLIFFRKKRWL
ncbi:MAG TPA: magnesium transporter CorA family protein [bacterium]|nr:magnesium transporter CorA family protein [bacterium]